jgi:diaminopimelate decarboxylase
MPAAPHSEVLPETAAINQLGHLAVGGCDTLDLAARFGTPLIVYDQEHLRSRCREALAAFPGGVSYATKAFTCRAMAALAHDEGLTLDVASAGEFLAARSAGVPADRLVVHGNNKSVAELQLALEQGVHRIAIDSADEFGRISALVQGGYPPPDAWLRINPGVATDTHPSIATGHSQSKFGVLAGAATDQLIQRILSTGSVRLRGIHMHMGSQIRDLEVYEAAVRRILPYLRRWDLPELCVGGGLAVAYTELEPSPSVASFAEAIRRACQDTLPNLTLSCELGRWIAATAGITLYTIGTVKHTPGGTAIAAVDGGMADNMRVALYGANYQVLAPDRPRTHECPVTVVGKHCESGDILARDVLLPKHLAAGDILCSLVTGAYGYSMASSYNRLGRPAVVFAANGRATAVLRRETPADMMNLDVWPTLELAVWLPVRLLFWLPARDGCSKIVGRTGFEPVTSSGSGKFRTVWVSVTVGLSRAGALTRANIPGGSGWVRRRLIALALICGSHGFGLPVEQDRQGRGGSCYLSGLRC